MSVDSYIGRFAPSPSGPLHFGSLVAALASYLDAKKNNGKWLVRIENIDPPREQLGATDLIFKALDTYGLHWDENPIYQSHRLESYKNILDKLLTLNHVYYCTCTRKMLASSGKQCLGECYTGSKPPTIPYTLRLKCRNKTVAFTDEVYGAQQFNMVNQGNCVLLRKSGLFAYQLAVVVDDIWQNITHVVRGADLLDSTPWQLFLFDILKEKPPIYTHIPLVYDNRGYKLSKQHGATAISFGDSLSTLYKALLFLELNPEPSLKKSSVHDLIEWGIEHWKLPVHHAVSNC